MWRFVFKIEEKSAKVKHKEGMTDIEYNICIIILSFPNFYLFIYFIFNFKPYFSINLNEWNRSMCDESTEKNEAV